MKIKLALGAIVALVAAQTAFAQASAPVSREERKAETAAANKAGKLTPAGQGPIGSAPGKGSDTTRDARKAQTQADAKSGKLAPAGEAADMKKDKADATKPSQTTREARKAQTEADRKAGKLTPAGEGAAMK
jgi:Domain of unknown function (DUF4148)